MQIYVEDFSEVVKAVLKEGDKQYSLNKVLYASFSIFFKKAKESKDEEFESKTATVHMLFFKPGDYVRVLGAVDDQWWATVSWEKVKNWRLQSQHDTCWRTDGFSLFNRISRAVMYGQGESEIAKDAMELFKDFKASEDYHNLRLARMEILSADDPKMLDLEFTDIYGETRKFLREKLG